ncbi:MAG: sodium:proton antiporter [Acidobacteria bacterium]|nr:sodium:proton antiporter [Acidobacteriota bacterium]
MNISGGAVTLVRTWTRLTVAVLLVAGLATTSYAVTATPRTATAGSLATPVTARAQSEAAPDPVAGDLQETLGERLSFWWVAPFILILLGIAIIPLIHGGWWESHLNKGVVSALCAVPVLAYLLTQGPVGAQVLAEVLHEYYAFIVLLIALYTISGGIYLEGDLRATPLVNTAFLAIGALLASVIGTTGAAMLLIRPLLRTNSERTRKTHIFVFFIFLVANVGGALLPVGDPPLFIGYLYGIPFFWTLRALWPMWLTAVAILLAVFYIWDTSAYSKEPAAAVRLDVAHRTTLRIHGRANILLVLGVLFAAIYLRSYVLPGGASIDISWMQQPVMLLLALISFSLDYRSQERTRRADQHHHRTPRDHNHFTFAPMIEVAVLFFGIFVTMIPAICLLKAHGAESGITEPWQFFWMTGGLSSFLDNAPTYATYFALGQGVTKALLASDPNLLVIPAKTGPVAANILAAISLGAVFMGANTYIGNAPNFMVRSICEEARVRMPSFFGYMLYSGTVLIPMFLLLMLIYLV